MRLLAESDAVRATCISLAEQYDKLALILAERERVVGGVETKLAE